MSYSDTIQSYTVGMQIVVKVVDSNKKARDISDAMNLQIIFTRPDHFTYSVNAIFITDGTDGQFYYISTISDFIIPGIWYLQGSYNIAGNQIYTQTDSFKVLQNLTQYNP